MGTIRGMMCRSMDFFPKPKGVPKQKKFGKDFRVNVVFCRSKTSTVDFEFFSGGDIVEKPNYMA